MKKNLIYVFQNLKSDEHQDAMFYSGIIATALNKVNDKIVCLVCRDAEIVYNGVEFIGQQIADLGALYVICDVDIDEEVGTVVDGFFYIACFNPQTLSLQNMEDVSQDLIFNTYDEAIKAFEEYVA